MKRSVALVPILLVAALARADRGRTLHEYVPGLGADEGTLLVSSGGAQPEAIVYQGEVLPAPEGGGLGPEEQPMRATPEGGRPEQAGRRSPSFAPDRVTQLGGTVPYYEVFTPAIAPFKRVTSHDAVQLDHEGTPILVTSQPDSRRPVEVLGMDVEASDGRPRDRFWGSVVLDFAEDRTVPLPSVAPESRILTLRTEPVAVLRIERDGADNFSATLLSERAPRQVRVVFLTDAPRDYFGTALPSGPVDALAARVPPLPPSVQRDAETFAAELGLSRQSTFDAAMRRLVAYFRSFEESATPPRNTGNIYLDLARGRRGICRHRVYAFMITAHALGIRARFVGNEAHAWAEVQLPDQRWLRVDLGGAAQGLEAHGARDRPVYSPGQDSLPRPPEYERAYDEARRMSGLRTAAGEGEGEGSAAAPAPGEQASNGSSSASSAPSPSHVPLGRLELAVDRRAYEVFRGRELEVSGVARGSRGGVSGLRVEVSMRAPRGGAERLLGVTVTGEAGAFHGVFGVPPELPVGDYRLIVRTPGNREHAPAEAR